MIMSLKTLAFYKRWIFLASVVLNAYVLVQYYRGEILLPVGTTGDVRPVPCPSDSTPPPGTSRRNVTSASSSPRLRHVRRCHVTPSTNMTFASTDITDMDKLDKSMNMTCRGCFPSHKIQLRPTTVCRTYPGQKYDELIVLAIVLSLPGDFEDRQNVRRSWAAATGGNTSPYMRHLFLLGKAASGEEQTKIISEHGQYMDILQKKIPEDLDTIGIKVIMGLQWAVDLCHRAAYILKTDMDSFVSVPQLMAAIASVGPEVGLFGHCKHDGVPIRTPEHKHHMTFDNYPAPYNPPYCFGAGYVLSMSAAKEVVRVAPDLSPIRLEDVFIGLCLREARFRGGAKHQQHHQRGHRIHAMPEFLDMALTHRCCDQCWGMYSKVVWHVADARFLDNAWRICFKLQCDSIPREVIALK